MRPPTAVTNSVSWRSDGIRYTKNEIFFDMSERMKYLFGADGSALWAEIKGSLRMRCFLSGMPEVSLVLNDKLRAHLVGTGDEAPPVCPTRQQS